MRKIIQIAIDPSTDEYTGSVYALCDDGTVWSRQDITNKQWYKLPPIPQESEND